MTNRFKPHLEALDERVVPSATYVWHLEGSTPGNASDVQNWRVDGNTPQYAPDWDDDLIFGAGKASCNLDQAYYWSIDTTGYTNTITTYDHPTGGNCLVLAGGSTLAGGTIRAYDDILLNGGTTTISGGTIEAVSGYETFAVWDNATVNVTGNVAMKCDIYVQGEFNITSANISNGDTGADFVNYGGEVKFSNGSLVKLGGWGNWRYDASNGSETTFDGSSTSSIDGTVEIWSGSTLNVNRGGVSINYYRTTDGMTGSLLVDGSYVVLLGGSTVNPAHNVHFRNSEVTANVGQYGDTMYFTHGTYTTVFMFDDVNLYLGLADSAFVMDFGTSDTIQFCNGSYIETQLDWEYSGGAKVGSIKGKNVNLSNTDLNVVYNGSPASTDWIKVFDLDPNSSNTGNFTNIQMPAHTEYEWDVNKDFRIRTTV